MVKKMDEEGGGTGGRPELGGGDDYDQNDFEQPSPKVLISFQSIASWKWLPIL